MTEMAIPDYKATLDRLRGRYEELSISRREIDEESAGLAKTIEALAALCGEESDIDELQPTSLSAGRLMAESWLKYMPFADAVRTALRIIAPLAFTTSELKEFLTRAGYPVHTKSDFMVALNVALKRLHDSEEVEITSKYDRKAYKWAFKNEMTPPPGYKPIVNWEKLVSVAKLGVDTVPSSEETQARGKQPAYSVSPRDARFTGNEELRSMTPPPMKE
jgi:hypothetical protein